MKRNLSVKKLAKAAGVSVRTLHLYDKMELLKPLQRTSAGYRLYGEQQLLRLQQILFYRELGFALKDILAILDEPHFDMIKALEGHRQALALQAERFSILIATINKTIDHLKNQNMENFEELYEGMPKEQVQAYRREVVNKWGEDVVLRSEKGLLEMPKLDLNRLKIEQKDIMAKLRTLAAIDPAADEVQEQIGRHYANIRSFWGVADPTDLKRETYKGLAELYVTDERYTRANGEPQPQFAAFMYKAMQ